LYPCTPRPDDLDFTFNFVVRFGIIMAARCKVLLERGRARIHGRDERWIKFITTRGYMQSTNPSIRITDNILSLSLSLSKQAAVAPPSGRNSGLNGPPMFVHHLHHCLRLPPLIGWLWLPNPNAAAHGPL